MCVCVYARVSQLLNDGQHAAPADREKCVGVVRAAREQGRTAEHADPSPQVPPHHRPAQPEVPFYPDACRLLLLYFRFARAGVEGRRVLSLVLSLGESDRRERVQRLTAASL